MREVIVDFCVFFFSCISFKPFSSQQIAQFRVWLKQHLELFPLLFLFSVDINHISKQEEEQHTFVRSIHSVIFPNLSFHPLLLLAAFVTSRYFPYNITSLFSSLYINWTWKNIHQNFPSKPLIGKINAYSNYRQQQLHFSFGLLTQFSSGKNTKA